MLPLFARCAQLWAATEASFLLSPLFVASAPPFLEVPVRGEDSGHRGPLPMNMKAFY